MASSGQPVKLSRPLDWLVIADHSDGMGMISAIASADPEITRFEQGRRWADGMAAGGQTAVETALDPDRDLLQGEMDSELLGLYSPGSPTYKSVWDHVVETAEAYHDPGRFTTLIGFEWTSLVMGNNLHRNVIFRDGGDVARQVVPYTTQAPIGSTDPLDLYAYLDALEEKTGGTRPRARAQRQPLERLHVPGRRAVHGAQHRCALRRGARPLGAALRDHADQG